MECTINNVDVNLDNIDGINVKLSTDDHPNTMEDYDDDNSTSENLDSTPNDNEDDEFGSTPSSVCEDDSIQNFSATLQNETKRISNVQNDFVIKKKAVWIPEPWFPSMSLLELAYKLKQAEYRVFGSSNGLQNNTETLSEASLKESSRYLNTRELGELNRNHNHSANKLNFYQSRDVSGSSFLPHTMKDFCKTPSSKLSSVESTNGFEQKRTFASRDSSYSAPISPSHCVTISDENNLNQETKSYYSPDVKNNEKCMNATNLSSMSLNYSESGSKYTANFFDEKRRYPCSFCSYRSDTRSHLKRHELAIHQNGAKARNRLPRVPEYMAAMTVSAAGGLGESYYRRHHCDQCMYQTNSACHLRRHQSTMHGNEKPFRCNICLLEFSRSEKVNQHFANFHPGVPFNIKAMRKVTAEKRSFQTKKTVPVGTVVKRDSVGAEIIDKEGESGDPVDTELAQLIEAAVTARGEGHKPFCCQLCLYSSRDVWHLRRHIADVHLKRRNYRCKVCRYATGRQDRLLTHMRSHGEMFCLYCDYSTAQVDTYRAHMQSCSAAGSRDVSSWNEPGGDVSSVTFSEQEQTCRLCNIVFSFRADLEVHIHSVHVETLLGSLVNEDSPTDAVNFDSLSDHRRYSCRACGHIAYDVESIQDHVMSHAPESYACTVTDCDFKSTYARTLELHRKYYHNAEASSLSVSHDTASPSMSKSVASSLISASSTPVKVFNASDVLTPTFGTSGSTAMMPAFMPSIGQFVCPICKDRAPFKYRRSFEKHITQHSVNVMICPMCVETFLTMDEMHAHMRSAHGANI